MIPDIDFDFSKNNSIIGIDSKLNVSGWDFYFTASRLRFQIYYPSNFTLYDYININLNLEEENTIVLKYFNSNVYFIVNGITIYTSVVSGLTFSGSGLSWMFNRSVNTSTKMDKSAFYDVKFEELDISGNVLGTLAEWPLNGSASDISGNGIDGTGVNITSANWVEI